MSNIVAEKKAVDFLQEHQITDFPINLNSIFKNLGIGYFSDSSLPSTDDGYLLVSNKPIDKFNGHKRVIVVNANHSKERQRFTAAHELGHFVLDADNGNREIYVHRDVDSYNGDEKEKEWAANTFAAGILMPRKFVVKVVNAYIDECEGQGVAALASGAIDEIAYRFVVSAPAARRRLRDVGYIK